MRQAVDVHRVLKFGTLRRDLILLAIFLAVAPVAVWAENWLILAICTVGGLFMLVRVIVAGPALVLLPEGIHYDYDGIKFFIPWVVVQAVEAREIAGRQGIYQAIVLGIPRAYYDAHIHVSYGKLLNPSRAEYFVMNGDTVEVAVFPAFLRVERAALLAEIEARWRAFGQRDPREDRTGAGESTSGL